jgi:hypothetical protein
MEQMNFHKQKLYALIAAAIGVISVFLPWWSVSFGMFGGVSVNGMRDLGILTFLGFIGAGVISFLGDKTKPFDGQFKLIAAAFFGGAALFALIQFLRATSGASFGVWLAILAGIAGGVIVYVLKPEQLDKKPPTTPNS